MQLTAKEQKLSRGKEPKDLPSIAEQQKCCISLFHYALHFLFALKITKTFHSMGNIHPGHPTENGPKRDQRSLSTHSR